MHIKKHKERAYSQEEADNRMNIQIFGTKKCFETKKAERYFKERGVKYQLIDKKV